MDKQHLVDVEAKLVGEVAKKKALVEQRRQAQRVLDAEIASLKAKQAAAAESKTRMETCVAAEQENVRQRQLAVAEAERNKEKSAKELELGLDYYRTRLGFRFERPSDNTDGLRMIFTNIDPCRYEREFFFSLAVNDAHAWELVECEPSLDPAVTSRLHEDLLAHNDLSAFVRGMRKAFKDSLLY